MMENSAPPENTLPSGTVVPPIARAKPEVEARSMPASPSLGGYDLVQPLAATDDGELWLARHKESGVTCGLALLVKDALEDPGAIWRLKQVLAQKAPSEGKVPMKLLTMNPPQAADDATNLRRIHSVRPGSTLPATAHYPGPVRRQRTEEDKKKERKIIWTVLCIFLVCLVAFGGFFAAAVYYVLVPAIKWEEERDKAREAVSNAREFSDAVDQWASDNSIPPGTVYTWHDISDHVPAYLYGSPKTTAPLDPLGNPYTFPATGMPVQIHPDTQTAFDKDKPDFIWD